MTRIVNQGGRLIAGLALAAIVLAADQGSKYAILQTIDLPDRGTCRCCPASSTSPWSGTTASPSACSRPATARPDRAGRHRHRRRGGPAGVAAPGRLDARRPQHRRHRRRSAGQCRGPVPLRHGGRFHPRPLARPRPVSLRVQCGRLGHRAGASPPCCSMACCPRAPPPRGACRRHRQKPRKPDHAPTKTRLAVTFAPLALLVALNACSSDVERTFGLTRDAPDEFTVTTRAPLSQPPEYTLTPRAPAPCARRN